MLATKALALDETLRDVVNQLQRITGVTNLAELNDLLDVNISNSSNGDILQYNSLSQEWENTSLPSGLHIYNTIEQRVGTWVDGKPIYEKTYNNVSVPVGSSTERHYTDVTSMSGLNIDKVIRLDGMWIDDTNWKPLACADNYSFQLVYNTTGNKITALTTNVSGTKTIFYTIQYTKTTDTV